MHGAVTILNATATGRGASLAVEGGVSAQWDWGGMDLRFDGASDDRLARQVHELLQSKLGRSDGAGVTTTAPFGPARGLKTSSGAAAAMLQAGATDAGQPMSNTELIHASIDASVAAGVTLTGAFDDQTAVVRGGCHVTDNAARAIVSVVPIEPWSVAIWVPDHDLPKSDIKAIDASVIAGEIEEAEALVLAGDVPGAMTKNGAAFTRLYQAAGLPVTDEAARVALAAGALGAGLSGTGPAVAALFEPNFVSELPYVAGGTWTWTTAVPA